MVSAIVERSEIGFKGMGYWCYFCLFEYRYTVGGLSYFGRFALTGYSKDNREHRLDLGEQASLDLGKLWVGKQITVRYDPAHPMDSFLAETELAGRRAYQTAEWTGSFQKKRMQ